MNELSKLFLNINDGDTVKLEKGREYHVCQDDSFEIKGYFCSNTAKKHENPEGLRRVAIYLKEKKNITVDGNGARITVHGKMTPMLFDRCENITVRDLSIDYACPTMTEFEILSNNGGDCTIRINPDCRFRVEGNKLIWQGEEDANGNPYWEDCYIGNRRYTKLYDPEKRMCRDFRRDDLEFETVEQIDDFTLRVVLKNRNVYFPAGNIMQTRNIVRDQTGSMFERCKNLTFENLRVMFMHGLGMVSQFCENVTYRNCDFTPKQGRTIASTADFFQFSGCRGKLTVENCRAWGAQDDYINVHGTHLRIVETNSFEKSITVRFMHAETWGFQAFAAGDEIEYIKWDTLKPYAGAKVLDFEKINDTDIKLRLSEELPEIEVGKDVVENATYTPELYVRNCDFGPTAGRGILCTTRGEVIIENNRFENLWGPALLVEDDCNFWFESGYTKEIIFRNNAVISCDYAKTWEKSSVIRYSPKVMDESKGEFVHGRLVLTCNSFKNPVYGEHCIWLEYLREAEICSNLFDAPYCIKTRCVGNVCDKGNFIKKTV